MEIVVQLVILNPYMSFHFRPVDWFLTRLLAQDIELANLLPLIANIFNVVQLNIIRIIVITAIPDFGDALLCVVKVHAINQDGNECTHQCFMLFSLSLDVKRYLSAEEIEFIDHDVFVGFRIVVLVHLFICNLF
jgi:hypothetical protein